MCTWFYAEKSTLSPIITKAQQLPLTNTIRNTMSRSAEMSGNIRPTDMAAVFPKIFSHTRWTRFSLMQLAISAPIIWTVTTLPVADTRCT